MKTIKVWCTLGESYSQAAKRAAYCNGLKISGNLRWHGLYTPAYQEVGTKTGETIRVYKFT